MKSTALLHGFWIELPKSLVILARFAKGCGFIWGIIFFLFWELIVFLWFQLEVETFQVGVGCPCRGGRPKKKQLEGGWGGFGS